MVTFPPEYFQKGIFTLSCANKGFSIEFHLENLVDLWSTNIWKCGDPCEIGTPLELFSSRCTQPSTFPFMCFCEQQVPVTPASTMLISAVLLCICQLQAEISGWQLDTSKLCLFEVCLSLSITPLCITKK